MRKTNSIVSTTAGIKRKSRKKSAAELPERPESFSVRARANSEGKASKGDSGLGTRALRTRDYLIQTAKALFLERGYGGTTIDHIAEAAGVSRASFYTYFPSKRETLLAAGTEGLELSMRTIAALADIPDKWTLDHLKAWIKSYLDYLDNHGGFLLVWSQAAWKDDELRSIGIKGSMRASGIIGAELQRLGASNLTDPRIQGQAVMAMLDRFWYVWRVTKAPFKEQDVIDGLAHFMEAILGRPR